MNLNRIRFDLGIRSLVPEWKSLFSTTFLKEDLIAGVTVACIALPLSLAIALASGVSPAVGLITAIVAGLTCALFGGTPLAVSGPAAAMAVLIAAVVQDFGMGGLLLVSLICGVLQLLTGVFGLGKIIRFVPVPVIAGFTAGIGAIILIGQLPRALGLAPPDQSHVITVITHIHDLIHETKLSALSLAMGTLIITFGLPRISPRLPASLVGVIIPTIVAASLGLEVELIGEIPRSLPMPHFPDFPASGNLMKIFGSSLIVFALASLETLLSSTAVDKLTNATKRHDSDQELVGQGFGNILCSLFGGIPATGVIARSALNIQAGARTRRAAIFHALILLIFVYVLAPWMSLIPTAVLSGILLSVALRMLHPRELIQIWHSSPIEAPVYVITFLTIVFLDLIMGVQAGLIAAFVIAAIRLGQTQANLHIFPSDSTSFLAIDGPLTFLSSSKLEAMSSRLNSMDLKNGLIMDLSEVTSMDASGAAKLIEICKQLTSKQVPVALQGLTPKCKESLISNDHDGWISSLIASTSKDVRAILGKEGHQTFERLIYGVQKFKSQLSTTLFEKLADEQHPHTLFITCSDSRINPNLITSTLPGEVFNVRNVGNIIPPFGEDSTPAEGAAVEFAIGVLEVKEIVICGHSGCGAMKEVMTGNIFSAENSKRYPSIANWLMPSRELKDKLPAGSDYNAAAKLNVLVQRENLLTYPLIQEKQKKGEITLHSWFYDIGTGEVEAWSPEQNTFIKIGIDSSNPQMKRITAGAQHQFPF